MLARRYAPTLSVASKVSSVLLKRISPDQAATPFNLAGFDAPESRGDRKLVSRSFCKRLDSIYFSAGDFAAGELRCVPFVSLSRATFRVKSEEAIGLVFIEEGISRNCWIKYVHVKGHIRKTRARSSCDTVPWIILQAPLFRLVGLQCISHTVS